jgi:methylmalonyl-CoA mutase cobalamin-binding subunit
MPYSADDLPLQNYDRQRAGAIAAKLTAFSQRELRVIREYEAEHERRAVVLDRIAELAGGEPWDGYDDQSADAIVSALVDADVRTCRLVVLYEREHKARAQIIRAAQRLAGAA